MRSKLIGKKVTIYEDPVTSKKAEGLATIVEVIDMTSKTIGGIYYRCNVRFDDGEIYERTIFVSK